MSDELSTRLGLPLLFAGQAQKELTHNEALTLLDLAVQPVVAGIGVNDPPAAPATGECWIVGPSPTGAWSGQAAAMAGWTAGGWRFLSPRAGWCVVDAGTGMTARFDAGGWTQGVVRAGRVEVNGERVVAARQPAVATPSGGTTIDAEARETLAGILAAMRTHGLISSV